MRSQQRNPKGSSDAALIRSHQRGNLRAWQSLVQRYLALTWAVPLALGCSTDVARAVCLEAWRALLERLQSPTHDLALGPWLLEAARAATQRLVPEHAGATESTAFAPLGRRLLLQQRIRSMVRALPADWQPVVDALYYGPDADAPDRVAEQLGLTRTLLVTHDARCLRQVLRGLAQADPHWAGDGVRADEALASCDVPFWHLVSYASGQLSGAPLERLTQHLDSVAPDQPGCAACQANLSRLEQLLGLMHTDRSPAPPDDLLAEVEALPGQPEPAWPGRWTPLAPDGTRAQRLRARLASVLVPLALVALAAAAYLYWPQRRSARITELSPGSVTVRLGSGAPWIEAQPGQTLTQGARLQGSETGHAVVDFWDDSLLRVESSASVELARMHASANRRVVRITVCQTAGSASYASPPPISGASSRLRVELPGATVDLEGTATLSVLTDGSLFLHVHQGSARVKLPEAQIDLAAGQELVVQETGAYMVL
ncbi:MAG: hypothetical protein GX557_00320 [Chloroflexi bacterium]|nr:hypothetical protein [Chloroflexota bacterium]